jgi:hypothetical protein
MAGSSDEATMVIAQNYATPAVAISLAKSHVYVDLARTWFRREPVLWIPSGSP